MPKATPPSFGTLRAPGMYRRNVWSSQLPVLLMPLLVVVCVASPDLAFATFSVDCARVRCCSSVGSVEAANPFKSGSFALLACALKSPTSSCDPTPCASCTRGRTRRPTASTFSRDRAGGRDRARSAGSRPCWSRAASICRSPCHGRRPFSAELFHFFGAWPFSAASLPSSTSAMPS